MNSRVLIFLFTIVGVNCEIQKETNTLANLHSFLWSAGTKMHEFFSHKKSLETLTEEYIKEIGEVTEELYRTGEYQRLFELIKKVEGEFTVIQSSILKIIDEFTDICNHNKQELKRMRKEVIERVKKNKLRANTKWARRKNRENKEKLALELRFLDEKERHLSLDFDTIGILKNQLELQARFIRAFIRGDRAALKSYQQLLSMATNRVEDVRRLGLNQGARESQPGASIPFWNDMTLEDLKKSNDKKEKAIRPVKEIDDELLRVFSI